MIPEYRVHSKDWDHWENIVHEALVNGFGRKQFYIETCTPMDITVWHYPHKDGATNYMELCEADLKENPDDWVMHLQLAIEYEIRGQAEKAIDHFQYIIDHDNTLQDFEVARCYFGLGRYEIERNPKKALNYYREGRLACSTFADNYLAAAEIYYNEKKYEQAIQLCRDAFYNCDKAVWCGVFDINNYYPYWLIGMSNYFLGDKIKALAYIDIALIKNQEDKELLNLRQEIGLEIVGDQKSHKYIG